MSRIVNRILMSAVIAGALSLPALAGESVQFTAELWDKADGSQGIKLSTDHVKPGKVEFVAKNVSTGMDHELLLYKTDAGPESLPWEKPGVTIDEDQLEDLEELGDLSVGQSKSTTLTLKPGKYLLLCNMPGSFKAGMYTAFTVEP